MHQTRIGDIEVLAVLDMVPPAYQPTVFFPRVPAEQWQGAASEFLVEGKLQLYYGCYAVRSPKGVVMVDSGKGPGPHADRGNRTGELPKQLFAHGIKLEDVNIVVHTHLHHDHVGWNITWTNGVPRATFPNARYVIAREEWEFFSRPEIANANPHIETNVLTLNQLGLLDLIDGPHTLTPGISTIPTPGHTPGHLNVVLQSYGHKGAIVGDVLHTEAQIGDPDWCSRADLDPGKAFESRLSMLELFAREQFLVSAGHFRPDRQFGTIKRSGGRLYWRPSH